MKSEQLILIALMCIKIVLASTVDALTQKNHQRDDSKAWLQIREIREPEEEQISQNYSFYCPLSVVSPTIMTGRAASIPKSFPERHMSLLVVVDNLIYETHRRENGSVNKWVSEIYSKMEQYYRQNLNVNINITAVRILKDNKVLTLPDDADDALEEFSVYQNQFRKESKSCFLAANLLTNQRFYVSVDGQMRLALGLARVGAACRTDAIAMITVLGRHSMEQVAKTVIHENSHILGMAHDNQGCTCNTDSCMMGPEDETSSPSDSFSDCSLRDYQYADQKMNYKCMSDSKYCKSGSSRPKSLTPFYMVSLVIIFLINSM